jgi:hypothetical protein
MGVQFKTGFVLKFLLTVILVSAAASAAGFVSAQPTAGARTFVTVTPTPVPVPGQIFSTLIPPAGGLGATQAGTQATPASQQALSQAQTVSHPISTGRITTTSSGGMHAASITSGGCGNDGNCVISSSGHASGTTYVNSLTVAAGATLYVDGSATIIVTNDVNIAGAIVSNGGNGARGNDKSCWGSCTGPTAPPEETAVLFQ